MKKILLTSLVVILLAAATANNAYSQFPERPQPPKFHHPPEPPHYKKIPYGAYCPGHKGDWYGAKKIIATKEQAREILKIYFSDTDKKIGKIIEKPRFFIAEILDSNNEAEDIVIVHKKTGRIRSIN